MARKPAKMYRRLKGPAYTRRKYIGGVPNNRIMQFHVGNRRAAETGQFLMELNLIADESCQIRHTALEAARVISNSTIRKVAGAELCFAHPHLPSSRIEREQASYRRWSRPCISRNEVCLRKECRDRSSSKAWSEDYFSEIHSRTLFSRKRRSTQG